MLHQIRPVIKSHYTAELYRFEDDRYAYQLHFDGKPIGWGDADTALSSAAESVKALASAHANGLETFASLPKEHKTADRKLRQFKHRCAPEPSQQKTRVGKLDESSFPMTRAEVAEYESERAKLSAEWQETDAARRADEEDQFVHSENVRNGRVGVGSSPRPA